MHEKIKKVKSTLVQWSKMTFKNIFQKIFTLENMIKAKKVQLEICPIEENRMALNKEEAELKRYHHKEREYQKQNSGMKWFKKRDRNTKFFHFYVKGEKRKLQVSEIQTMQGDVISTTQNIREEVVNVFKKQFSQEQKGKNL